MRSSQLLDPVANRMHDAGAGRPIARHQLPRAAHRGSSDDIELEKPFGRPRRLPPRYTVVPFVRLGHPSSAHPSVTCERTIRSPPCRERRTSRRRSHRSHRPTRPGPRRLRTARSRSQSRRGVPAHPPPSVRARRVDRRGRPVPVRRRRLVGPSAPAAREDRLGRARQWAPADRWVPAGLGRPALRWDLEGPLDLAARAPVRCIPQLRASR